MNDKTIAARVGAFDRARHIKLGKGNGHAGECIASSSIYIGYETGAEVLAQLERDGDQGWDRLRQRMTEKAPATHPASVTAAINQMRSVIDDDGTTLWFTFFGTHLYWTFIDPASRAEPWDASGHGGRRRTLGWNRLDLRGKPIHTAEVTTRISQVQAYQRTVREYADQEDAEGFNPVAYLRHLVQGQRQPVAVAAEAAAHALQRQCIALIRRLTDKEFENFVDLVFVSDGWLRRTEVGGTMKDVDGEYVHASTGLVAKVQVKSSTSTQIVRDSSLLDAGSEGVLLYWVFHSERDNVLEGLARAWGVPDVRGGVPWFAPEHGGIRRTMLVLGPDQLAELALRKGLAHWLVQKAG